MNNMEKKPIKNMSNNVPELTHVLVISMFMILLLSGCAIFRTGVDVANNAGDIQNCDYVGNVYGTAGNANNGDWFDKGTSALFAKGDLKRQARELGGDTILIKYADPNGEQTTLKGEAYDCSNADG